MTKYDNLTGTERQAYVQTLGQSHRIRNTISIFSNNETHEEDIDVQLVGGQVDVDGTSDIVRQLSLDVAGPSATRLTPERFIGVLNEVEVAGVGWVQVPVFFGPITRISRDTDVTHVEASSKESLMLPPVWFGYGRPLVDPTTPFPSSLRAFIQTVARSAGETKLALGHSKGPALSLDRKKWERIEQSDNLWAFLQHLAKGADRELVYRANGVLALEWRRQGHARYIFKDGPGGVLLNVPHVEWDLKDAINAVRVMGPKTKTAKTATLRAKTQLPRSSAISPGSLARGGAPRFLMQTIDVDAVMSPKDALALAKKTLNRSSLGTLGVSFDCLPVPHLEPGDLVAVQSEGFAGRFLLQQFTLPLTADTMSVGFTKQLTTGQFRAVVHR